MTNPPGSSRVSTGEMTMKLAALLLVVGTPCLISGCAMGMAGSSRRICYDVGLQPGTPEFSSCWKGVRKQQFANDGQMIQGLVATAAVVGAATLAAQNADTANTRRESDDGSPRAPVLTPYAPFTSRAPSRYSLSYNMSSPICAPTAAMSWGDARLRPMAHMSAVSLKSRQTAPSWRACPALLLMGDMSAVQDR